MSATVNSRVATSAFILLVALAVSSCRGSENESSWKLWGSRPNNSSTTGRFVLLQGQRVLSDGAIAPLIMRMDSQTGETWILQAGESAKWVQVEDNLQPVGKYDPVKQTLVWGVRLPDGRYAWDLSKEELVRQLETLIGSGRTAGQQTK